MWQTEFMARSSRAPGEDRGPNKVEACAIPSLPHLTGRLPTQQTKKTHAGSTRQRPNPCLYL